MKNIIVAGILILLTPFIGKAQFYSSLNNEDFQSIKSQYSNELEKMNSLVDLTKSQKNHIKRVNAKTAKELKKIATTDFDQSESNLKNSLYRELRQERVDDIVAVLDQTQEEKWTSYLARQKFL